MPTKQLNVLISRGLDRRLRKAAHRRGKELSESVRDAIEMWLRAGDSPARIRRGMETAIRKGGFPGMSAPYGYDLVAGGLSLNRKEAAVVRQIFLWREGINSMEWISEKLNENGIPTKMGKKWTKRQVFRILHNPLYQGTLRWGGLRVPGKFEPIALR